MRTGIASGAQIAFFTFAAGILLVVAWKWIEGTAGWSGDQKSLIKVALPLVSLAAILFAIPSLRRWCRMELAHPIPEAMRWEVGAVAIGMVVIAFGVAGAMVLTTWLSDGASGLAQRVRAWPTHEHELDIATSLIGLSGRLLLAVVLAPIVEELLFRGLLYQAWERQLGWVPSMLLTSVLFGAYHGIFWFAFAGSIVYVCLYRRTGTLRASILVHMTYNAAMWYPALGQYVLPRTLDTPGDLSSWGFHLMCALIMVVAIPVYLWMAARSSRMAAYFRDEPLPR